MPLFILWLCTISLTSCQTVFCLKQERWRGHASKQLLPVGAQEVNMRLNLLYLFSVSWGNVINQRCEETKYNNNSGLRGRKNAPCANTGWSGRWMNPYLQIRTQRENNWVMKSFPFNPKQSGSIWWCIKYFWVTFILSSSVMINFTSSFKVQTVDDLFYVLHMFWQCIVLDM